MRFDITAKNINPLQDGIILKIRATDVEKADEILSKNNKTNLFDEHYLYSFSDSDIMDIIVNPEEWTEEELALAKKISKERHLQLTEEVVKSLRKEKINDKINEQIKQKNIIQGGASWFLWIGILSILTTINISMYDQNLGGIIRFPVGLGINEGILGFVFSFRKTTGINLTALGFILTLLLPIFFFWIWTKSRKGNRKVYLTGIIVYGIDTLLFGLIYFFGFKDWAGIVFHLFVLWMLCAGYTTLLENKKAKDKN
ncbi:MAG: hypothetical protein LBR81_09235 [Prevotellaceae bacterium]|nr:hypothetical protein [Prevotellaceae bacterium]